MGVAFRRWYFWVLLLLLVAAAGYGVHRATRPAWEETEAWAVYRQLQLGMAFDEAEAAIGRRHSSMNAFLGVAGNATWRIGDDRLEVVLDGGLRVCRKRAVIQGHEFQDPPAKRPWWERCRALLGLYAVPVGTEVPNHEEPLGLGVVGVTFGDRVIREGMVSA